MADERSAADVDERLAQAERRVREIEALYHISQVLATGATQREKLAAVLDVLDHDLRMRRGTVALVSPDGRELLMEVAHNLSDGQLRAVRYDVGEGIVGQVVQTAKPAIVPKISQEPVFLDRLHQRRKLTREEISFVCVPVAVGPDVIGALSADRLFDESASLDEDVRVLSIVATMIATDVQSRREQEAERRALEAENIRLRSELEERFRPENIVGNSGAMRAVYRAIHQGASRGRARSWWRTRCTTPARGLRGRSSGSTAPP